MQGKVGAVLAPLGFGLLAIALLGAAGANAVTDAAPPSLTLPAAATTNATSSGGAVVSFIAVATDDVQPTSLTCAPASGARFAAGTTTVTCTAMDAASHATSASFAITVLGASEQLALLRTAVIALGLSPDLQQALLDKLDSAKQSIQASQSRIACNQLNAFAKQVNAQTKKAIADGTNLLTRQNEIEAALDCVASKAAPVVLGPSLDVTTNTAPGLSTATVRYTGPSCNPASPAALPVGTTKVTCQATNPNGTTKTSFNVTVLDREAPVLMLPSDIMVNAPAGSSTAVVTFAVTATDNVGVSSTVCTPSSGSAFAYGATTVNCIATDTSGNAAIGSFRVTVNFAISGRVTSSAGGGGIAGISVELFGAGGAPNLGLSATTASDGRYSIVAQPGSYTVFFNRAFTAPYSRQWWNHQPDDPDTLVVAGSVGGIDASLSPGIFVHGRVTDEVTNQGIPRVFAAAIDATAPCCRFISGGGTNDNGDYTFVVPSGSSIKVQFTIDLQRRYLGEWWDNKPNFDSAAPFSVSSDTFHIDAALTPAVLLSGRITDDQTGAGLGGIAVNVTDSTTHCCPFGNISFGSTAPDGTYHVLAPKGIPVKINFFPFGAGSDPRYIGEWFDNQPSWDSATIETFTSDTAGIDAALTRGFYISGHVTRRDTGTPIQGLHANANDGLAPCCRFISSAQTNSNGDYAILVRPGTYKVLFFSRAPFLAADGLTYIDQVWNGAQSFEQGTPIVVGSADVSGINAVMTRAVIVSGHVSDASGLVPVGGFEVNALDATVACCQFIGGAQTDAQGNYSIAVAPGVSVKVDFGVFSGPPPGTRYLPQWWNNKTSFDAADPILATADVPNINARLANGFLITGHVTERGSGAALAGMHVQVFDPAVPCCPFREIAHSETSATGDYAVVLAAGSYKVQFSEFPQPAVRPHLTQWWQDKPFDQGADLLVVAGDRTGIDATLPVGVFISGTVTAAGGTVAVVGLNVSAQDASQACCHFVGGAQTDTSGNYRFPVPAGSSLKVEFGVFSGPPPGTSYLGQWWNNKPDFGVATTINALSDVSGINADLASGFVLSGHVSDASGTTPVGGIGVNANDATTGCCQFIVGTQTDAAGNYRLIVPSGRLIRVFFSTNPGGGVRYRPQWWNDKPFFDQADDIAMTQDRPGIDARLASGVLIHGRVTDATGTIPVVGLNVSAHDATQSCCQFVGGSQTDLDGQYTMVVPSGHDVKIAFAFFSGPPPGTRYLGEWYNDAPTFDTATPVTTATDQNGIDARLEQGFVISGMVRAPGGAGVPNAFVGASIGGTAQCCTGVGGANTDPTGHYRLVLRAGLYRINVQASADRRLVAQWWAGVPGGTAYFQRAPDIALGPNDANDRDFDVVFGTLIQGHVSDASNGAALGGIGVTANEATIPCCEGLAFAGTDPQGNYFLVVPSGRQVRVFFSVGPGSPYTAQWWDNKPDFGVADLVDTSIDHPAVDAHLTSGFVISGHVIELGGGPLGGVDVAVIDPVFGCCPFHEVGHTQTNANGDYSVRVPAGTYKIEFSPFPPTARPHMYVWWPDRTNDQDATPIVVIGDRPRIDAALPRAVFLRGHVSDATTAAPIPGTFVAAWDATVPCCRNFTGDITDSSGNYEVIAPLGGHVKVGFGPPSGSRYVRQFWDGQPSFDTATTLEPTADLDQIDAHLQQGFVISGTLTYAGGPASGIQVNASRGGVAACCEGLGQTTSDNLGHYQLTLPAGTYRINVSAPLSFHVVTQWWNGTASGTAYFDRATDITVGPNDTSDKNFTVVFGSLIEGRVTAAVGGSLLSGVGVTANDGTLACCEGLAFTGTDSAGNYALVVPRGRQVKVFFGPGPSSTYVSQWWNGRPDFGAADMIDTSVDRSGINAQLSARVAETFTITGRVTEQGTAIPLAGIRVQVFDASVQCCVDPTGTGGTTTDALGNYSLTVPGGRYILDFYQFPFGDHPHYVRWWHDKQFSNEADVLVVSGNTTGIDQSLPAAVFIGGRVTAAADGHGIAGLQVSAQDGTLPCCRFIDAAQTDADGYYRFIAPLGGSIKVEFGVFGGSPPGTSFSGEWWNDKASFDLADVILTDGDRSDIDATLAPGVTVSGRVTDTSGGPIGGVQVYAADGLANPCCGWQNLGSATTDASGNYSIALATGSTVKIQFVPSVSPGGPAYLPRWWNNKPDFASADAILVNTSVTNINQSLTTGYRISGRVTDAANAAVGVPGVFVGAQPNSGCCFYGTQTDAEGRYSFVAGAGTYRISFFSSFGSDFLEQWWNSKASFGAADLVAVPSATVDLSSINAALIHGIPVRGMVTDAIGGAPVGSVGVVASLDDPAVPCCVNYQAQTGVDGRYTLYVRAGKYRINFQPPSTSDFVIEYWNDKPDFASATVLDVTGPTSSIDAALDRGFAISGRVTDAVGGAAVQGSVVTINPQTCCQAFTVVQTASDGTYSVTVRPGSYKIGFYPPYGSDFVSQYWNSKPDFGSADLVVVDVAPRPNINAVLAHGFRITGRITDASDPTVGLANATVSAYTPAGFQYVASAVAGSDGRYALFLPSGDYIVFFGPPYLSDYLGEYWNDKTDQASADVVHVTGPMSDLNASLTRGLRISGRITDETGQPIAGILVNVNRPSLPFQFVGGATTDADGRYSVPVPPGSYKVFFQSGARPFISEWWNDKRTFEAADPIDVTASVGAIDGVLAPGVLISGHVTSTGGLPLAGVTVYLYDGSVPCCVYLDARGTGPEGTYSFAVPSGNYYVGFSAPNYDSQYWNGKARPDMADLIPATVDHLAIDAVMVPAARQLTSFDMSAAPTDTSTGATAITFTVRVTGFASLGRGWILFGSPSGTQPDFLVEFDAAARIDGDEHSGTYRFDGVLPGSAEHGTWTITSVSLYEAAGPFLYFTPADLAARGFPTQVTHGP